MFYSYPILLFIDEAEFYGPIYIKYCEYFQLDPRVNYTYEQFSQRYQGILEKYKSDPGLLTPKNLQEIEKGLKWIQKRKDKLPLIVNFTTKLLIQKLLIIPEDMIHEVFSTRKGLTKDSIKPYQRYERNVLIGFFIFLMIFLAISIVGLFFLFQTYN